MMANDAVDDLHVHENTPFEEKCDACSIAKFKALPHKSVSFPQSHDVLDVVSMDYKGPVEEPSLLDEANGYVVVKDLGSRLARVYIVSSKDVLTQLDIFKNFKAWAENKTGKKIKALRHDKAREYLGTEFNSYLDKCGISQQTTAGYSPESNGVAESHIRLLTTISRCYLS